MASSTPYWMMGLSTSGSISLGCALVAGRKRVPSPAAGKTALRTFAADIPFYLAMCTGNRIMRCDTLEVPRKYGLRNCGTLHRHQRLGVRGRLSCGLHPSQERG